MPLSNSSGEDDDDVFNDVEWEVDPSQVLSAKQPKRHGRVPNGARFIHGPISLEWILCVLTLPGRTPIKLALLIRHLEGLNRKTRTLFPLSNKFVGRYGIDRHAKSRTLKKLQSLGLIAIEQRPGCAPLITVIETRNEPRHRRRPN